jgi:hypothetical protein
MYRVFDQPKSACSNKIVQLESTELAKCAQLFLLELFQEVLVVHEDLQPAAHWFS